MHPTFQKNPPQGGLVWLGGAFVVGDLPFLQNCQHTATPQAFTLRGPSRRLGPQGRVLELWSLYLPAKRDPQTRTPDGGCPLKKNGLTCQNRRRKRKAATNAPHAHPRAPKLAAPVHHIGTQLTTQGLAPDLARPCPLEQGVVQHH